MSYAEPNLRDKMRRPTSEFADAVSGDRTRRASSSQISREYEADGFEMRRSGITGVASAPNSNDTAESLSQSKDDLPDSSRKSTSARTQRRRKPSAANDESPINQDRHCVAADADADERSGGRADDHKTPGTTRSALEETGHGKFRSQSAATHASERSRRNSSVTELSKRDRSHRPGAGLATAAQTHRPTGKHAVDSHWETSTPELGQGDPFLGVLEKDDAHEVSRTQPRVRSSAEDTKQPKRGQRVAARRRSMML